MALTPEDKAAMDKAAKELKELNKKVKEWKESQKKE